MEKEKTLEDRKVRFHKLRCSKSFEVMPLKESMQTSSAFQYAPKFILCSVQHASQIQEEDQTYLVKISC